MRTIHDIANEALLYFENSITPDAKIAKQYFEAIRFVDECQMDVQAKTENKTTLKQV